MNIQTRCTLRTRLSSEKRYDLLTRQKFYDMMKLIEKQQEPKVLNTSNSAGLLILYKLIWSTDAVLFCFENQGKGHIWNCACFNIS